MVETKFKKKLHTYKDMHSVSSYIQYKYYRVNRI